MISSANVHIHYNYIYSVMTTYDKIYIDVSLDFLVRVIGV